LAVVGQQRDDDRLGEVHVLAQILANLQCFDLPDTEVDDDTVRVKALGLNPALEAAGCDRDLEGPFGRQFALQVLDQNLVLSHEQHLGHTLVFEVAKGHTVFLQELDQVFPWNTAVLAAGDSVPLQSARVEPLADRPRGHFADLRDLSSSEHLHDISSRERVT